MKHARADYDRIQDPAGLIPDDEPVFLIRGQDVVGGATLRHWARLNDEAHGDPRASAMARVHAQRMDDWPRRKPADLPDPVDADDDDEEESMPTTLTDDDDDDLDDEDLDDEEDDESEDDDD